MAQIAGRAGRHLRDGTFGTTGRCPPLDAEMVEALESHTFEPLRMLQWRNPDLDFRSVDALRRSLGEHPSERGLTRAPTGDDEAALDLLAKEDDIRDYATSRSAVERLWQVCGVPDYRKSAIQTHADLIAQLFRFLMRGMAGRIPVDWFSQHVAMVDRTDGDIDALSQRIAPALHNSFEELDLRGEPTRLARRPGALAGRDASGRGQAVRRPARAAGESIRRSAHQRADAAPEREYHVGS